MAGDWIKVRCDLQTHPKVVRILSAIRRQDVQGVSDKFRIIGGLHAVWTVFDQHSTDGKLPGYTPEIMDHVIGFDGFSQSMIDVGWLHTEGKETLVMPEFAEHNGKSGKRRAEDQKRKRDARRASEDCPEESGQNADKMRTREEKRRDSNNPLTPSDGKKQKPEPTPYQEIMDAYNRLCPSLKTCRTLNDKRKRRIKKLWGGLMPTMGHWEAYFEDCENTDKYTGKVPPKPPYEEPFVGWFDFILRDETITSVLER